MLRDNTQGMFDILIKEHAFMPGTREVSWESDILLAMSGAAAWVFRGYPCAAEEVEDVVNETVKSVFERFERRNNDLTIDNLKAYLVRATVNKAITKARKLNRERANFSTDNPGVREMSDHLLSHPKRLEIRASYFHFIKKLTEKERTIVKLMIFGLSPFEISRALSMKGPAVNTSIHRIRLKLSPLKEYLNW